MPMTESDKLSRLNIFNENLNEIQETRNDPFLETINFNPFSPCSRPSSIKQYHNIGVPINNYVDQDSTGLINDPLFRNQLQCFLNKNQENLPILKKGN